ncbi:electron transfer flavoprotein-ubiquinone oxidoreductase [Marinicellulosiphila megalodicopiae]|uniref:electron transfer flavoprotein-ubiquinone oxidoreductase n=1 Tax=Marinicellulosiphila megalodicopiae TaxID=2724896 RepID=UPI003BB04D90
MTDENIEYETMEFDVVIIGAGPAGLSAAIKLKQLNAELNVVVLEKGSEVGAHIISGALFETKALEELFPNWQDMNCPVNTKVTSEQTMWYDSETQVKALSPSLIPKPMHNDGNYIISLGNLCRWLGEQAQTLGVEIFPGFCAIETIKDNNNQVIGVKTGKMGIDKQGKQKDSFVESMLLLAPVTLICEGARGQISKQLIKQYNLDKDCDPQHFGLGIKELWKIDPSKHKQGHVEHGAGWPLSDSDCTGGSFLYHMEDNQVVLGLITDLNYSNPHVSPYDEFQRFKQHPHIKEILTGGERLVYGARTIAKGGPQSLPKMHFPGGLLLGCSAGTLNAAKIKGSHTAMKSGIEAAIVIAQGFEQEHVVKHLAHFEFQFNKSWAYQELTLQRNFAPAVHKWGAWLGGAYAFIDINIFKGKLPWTLHDKTPDHLTLQPADRCDKIQYDKYDGVISFDKPSSVFLSNTNHEEDQPCHLKLSDESVFSTTNLPIYHEPAQRYCPAGVYEVIGDEQKLQINAQNCLHCKACDIKDPTQNITWTAPEGGGGPNYPGF